MARFLVLFFLGALAILILAALIGRSIFQSLNLFPSSRTGDGLINIVTPAPLVTPFPSTNQAPVEDVLLYFVFLEDNGVKGEKIGCGDSLVPVTQSIPRTTTPLRTTLEALLAVKTLPSGGNNLYNALAQSNLIVQDVSIDSAGLATIRLAGTLTLGGVCDNPRVEAQLKRTALQFPTVKSVSIFVNGTPLEQLLSGRG